MYLHCKTGVCRDVEGFTADNIAPLAGIWQLHFQLPGQDFHRLLIRCIESVLTRHHEAQGFTGAVGKLYGTADNFSVEIDIGFLDNGDIGKFSHDFPYKRIKNWRMIAEDKP
jgi:hypothetical protein